MKNVLFGDDSTLQPSEKKIAVSPYAGKDVGSQRQLKKTVSNQVGSRWLAIQILPYSSIIAFVLVSRFLE